jgi:hypothetical protein
MKPLPSLPKKPTVPPPLRPSQPTLAHAVPPMPTPDNMPAPSVLPAREVTPKPAIVAGAATNLLEAQSGDDTTDVGVPPVDPAAAAVTEEVAAQGDSTDQTGQPMEDLLQTVDRLRKDSENQETIDIGSARRAADDGSSKTPIPSTLGRRDLMETLDRETVERSVADAALSAPTPIPLSTAPTSLPPPKQVENAPTGPRPACPQCEAPMAWVEEHLRFYCKQCRMYF